MEIRTKKFIEEQIDRLRNEQPGGACAQEMCGHRNIDKASQRHGEHVAMSAIYKAEINYYKGLLK